MLSQATPRNFLYFPHKNQYLFEISQKISFCSNCSSVIITEKNNKTVSTIKPLKYHQPEEIAFPIFLNHNEVNKINLFLKDKEYIKIRSNFVKRMKTNCEKLQLNLKTYFLALDYFDRICSVFTSFDNKILNHICDMCIIISSKLNESGNKSNEVKYVLSKNSDIFAEDEIFILKLLKHDLIKITSYDILMDILKCGFIFDDEQFPNRKMYSIYDKIENMLYLFSESKNYIYMSPKETALGIIGLTREILGLTAFSKNVQIAFLNEFEDIHNFIKCLNKIRKCFKIKECKNNSNNIENKNVNNSINNSINNNQNHSDSTKDSNSDNN